DHVALQDGARLDDQRSQRRAIDHRPLDLSQRAVGPLERLHRVAKLDVKRRLDLDERTPAAPLIGEIDVVRREWSEVLFAAGLFSRGKAVIDDAQTLLRQGDSAGREAAALSRPVAVAVFGGDHHQGGRQLWWGELLQPAIGDRLGDDQAVLAVDPGGEQSFVGRLSRLQEPKLLEHAPQRMHPPAVLTLAPLGVVLGCADPGLQLADLGMMGAVLGQERALAAGELRQLVLPALHLRLELGQGLAARLSGRPASEATAPAVVMVAAEPAHAYPKRRDFLLGPNE